MRCLIHTADEAPLLELLSPKIEVVVGDVRDPVALDRLFDGVDGAPVFHVAAVIHPTQRTREFFDVNVGGTEMVLDRGPARRTRPGSCTCRRTRRSARTRRPTDRFTEDSPFNPYMGYGALEARGRADRAARATTAATSRP